MKLTTLAAIPRSNESLAELLASLPERDRLKILGGLTEAEALALEHDWRFWGRPKQQIPEGNWLFWLILAGRGYGKTRTGGEFVRYRVKTARKGNAGDARGILIAPTWDDIRDTMIEGESGILAISPKHERPDWNPSKKRLVWPNGVTAKCIQAETPERLRGPQCGWFWGDEFTTWKYPDMAWSNLMFGFRLGDRLQGCLTTTPKPIKLLKAVLGNAKTHVTRGSSYENIANLATAYIQQVIKPYEGTRLGRQELNAEVLDDVPGALWNRTLLDATRVAQYKNAGLPLAPKEFRRIVVAIDPAATSGEDANETGLIVAGVAEAPAGWVWNKAGTLLVPGTDLHGYVLEDLSGRYKPHEWAKIAIDALDRWKGDRIVAERNNGGEMVESTIRAVNPNVPVVTVWASRGKYTRAEPISALYEQGRIHHVGSFAQLEDQQCNFVPGGDLDSPDRMDAAVWAFTDLMLENQPAPLGIPVLDDFARTSPWVGR